MSFNVLLYLNNHLFYKYNGFKVTAAITKLTAKAA